ncbi:unnamed protein product [Rotaria sordida]|uniref:Cytochrome P450 n=1 Tax=Rotaria sordida TaxID=392033 RepID=A0A815HQY9_9BILA|nr:unnamed protein product [Rotaria sordida]
MAQIESLSTHQILQHLGSETMTNMNLTILSNVGRKMPSQETAFDFDQNGTIGGKQGGTAMQSMNRNPPKPHTYEKVQVNAIKSRVTVREKTEPSEARSSENEDDVIEYRITKFSSIHLRHRIAFLDSLIVKMNDKQMSIDDVQEEVDTFMFESHDTTATAFNFALFMIALHQDIQQCLFEELQSIFGKFLN